MAKGKIIAIEGIDGCGKTTQIEKIKEYFDEHNVEYRFIKFPIYENDTATPIKEYLHGDLSANPYQVSAFFAIDRLYSFLSDWKKDYNDGKVILLDRYVYSNLIFQYTKVLMTNSYQSADHFYNWLMDYEYNILGLPKPDLNIFLDIDPNVSQKLMSKRYEGDESKKDINEKDIEFQCKCRDVALNFSTVLNWDVIPVSENGVMKSIDNISSEIIGKIEGVINDKKRML